ncbi:MAG TPA: helix-turn-helix transcriptional regulator, partial [Actinomycetes bacterium]|nr:helix-turn-helix transcriptional regulator [Actinomycetes bacterium]
ATLNVTSLGDYIREQRESAQVSLRQLAKVAGVSNPYLSQIERGVKKPSAEILQQIAKGLRISAETLYVRAGILDEQHGPGDVVAAVMSDPSIGERHKRVLLDIYQSFRAEHAASDGDGTPMPAARTTATRAGAKKTTKKTAKKTATKTTATRRKSS